MSEPNRIKVPLYTIACRSTPDDLPQCLPSNERFAVKFIAVEPSQGCESLYDVCVCAIARKTNKRLKQTYTSLSVEQLCATNRL